MKNLLITFVVLFSFFTSLKTQADVAPGWMLQPSLMYYFTTEGGNPPNNGNVTTTRELGNVLFGYTFGNIFLGANYNYDAIVIAGTTTSTDSYQSFGGDLGIMTDNLYLFFTYYFSSTAAVLAGTPNEVDFKSGTGYQINLGYLFDIGSGFFLGPSMTYKSLTYAAFANPNPGTSTSFTFTTLVPEATIRYRF